MRIPRGDDPEDGGPGVPRHRHDPAARTGHSDEVRRQRLVGLLLTGDEAGEDDGPGSARGARDRLARVCAVAVTHVAVDGAGITVMGGADAGRAGHRDQLAACGPLTRRLEDLQLTTGEGPCLDAHTTGMPVLAGNLTADVSRWLGFGPEALAVGAAAVFSLPLQVGAVRMGTLDLYRARPGPLSHDQLADALALASLTTETVLHLTEQLAPDDPAEGCPGRGRRESAGWLPEVHADVHVASGMISERAGIDIAAALLRIRAYAFSSGEPISEVARRIVERALFDTAGTDHRPHDEPEPDADP